MVRLFFSSLLLLQCVCVLPVAVSAQANPSAIKSAAIAMGNALVKKNSEQFLSYFFSFIFIFLALAVSRWRCCDAVCC